MAGLAITAFVPSMVSNGTFATRRANKGMESMETNPFVGILNMNLAGAQTMNMAKGISHIINESNGGLAARFKSAEESIKEVAKTDKVLSGTKKLWSVIADNINKFIVFIAGVKVLFAEDKKEAIIDEGVPLLGMFAGEHAYKKFMGLPQIKNINNKSVVIEREALYKKNPFLKKQAEAIKDYCETAKIFNKSLKFLPGALKGAGFALTSIGTYALCDSLVENRKSKQSA